VYGGASGGERSGGVTADVIQAQAHSYLEYFHATFERHSRAGGNPILREYPKHMPAACCGNWVPACAGTTG
jgi:hypothetical protein